MKSNEGFFLCFMGVLMSLLCFGLFLIVRNNKSEIVEEKMVEVELVVISNPSKHFHVDIRDFSTGIVWKNEYVSKHYHEWKKLPMGKPFLATRVTKKLVNQDNKIVVDWLDLESGLNWTIGKQ